MVELVDTQDLKSCSPKSECGFDSRPRYKTDDRKLNVCLTYGFFVMGIQIIIYSHPLIIINLV